MLVADPGFIIDRLDMYRMENDTQAYVKGFNLANRYMIPYLAEGDRLKHIVLDLETLGVTPGCPILSIGAIGLNENYDVTAAFYGKASIKSNLDMGFVIDADTLEWWLNQQENYPRSFTEAFHGTLDIQTLLTTYGMWESLLSESGVYIWGNGCDFDNVILEAAYRQCKLGMKALRGNVTYVSNQSLRTIEVVAKVAKLQVRRATEFPMKHHALWDAAAEASYLQLVMRELTNKD